MFPTTNQHSQENGPKFFRVKCNNGFGIRHQIL